LNTNTLNLTNGNVYINGNGLLYFNSNSNLATTYAGARVVLYPGGGLSTSTDWYGLGMNSYILVYNAPTGARHSFQVNGTEVGYINSAGLTVTSAKVGSQTVATQSWVQSQSYAPTSEPTLTGNPIVSYANGNCFIHCVSSPGYNWIQFNANNTEIDAQIECTAGTYGTAYSGNLNFYCSNANFNCTSLAVGTATVATQSWVNSRNYVTSSSPLSLPTSYTGIPTSAYLGSLVKNTNSTLINISPTNTASLVSLTISAGIWLIYGNANGQGGPTSTNTANTIQYGISTNSTSFDDASQMVQLDFYYTTQIYGVCAHRYYCGNGTTFYIVANPKALTSFIGNSLVASVINAVRIG